MFAVRLKIIVGRYFLNGAERKSCANQSLTASLLSKSAIARQKWFVCVVVVLRVNVLRRLVGESVPVLASNNRACILCQVPCG